MHAFLFKALESSTQLLEERPEDMKGVSATHEETELLEVSELQARHRLIPLLRQVPRDDGIDKPRAIFDLIHGDDKEPDVLTGHEALG